MNIKKMIKLKSVLLLCLVWICVFAIPVQGQATPTPISCDATNALADATTYELSADCTGASTVITVATSVTAIINGNGNTISGATGTLFDIAGTLTVSNLTISGAAPVVIDMNGGGTLTLNDVTITGSASTSAAVIDTSGAGNTITARNVIFRDNPATVVVYLGGTNTNVDLMNVQFLNNGLAGPRTSDDWGSAIGVAADAASVVDIEGATFSGNSGQDQVIRVWAGTLNISGCVRVSGNTNAAGDAPAEFATKRTAATINGGPGGCPRPRKKEVTPVPTATERPPTAATCIGLREATGIAVSATFGLGSGVQCQQLDGGGIGIQALAENYIAAVDIWGYVDQGVEVCFPQATGRIFFLDARMIPRSVVPMQSYVADGMLCASTETPGSIVLLPPE